MKRYHLLYIAAVLLLSGTASASLTVYEYVPGEKVTLDTATGNYWYWDVNDFTNMTYGDQISAIAALGNYGNIAGGWHMATREEITQLWAYPADVLLLSFNYTWKAGLAVGFEGRYNDYYTADHHYMLWVQDTITGPIKSVFPGTEIEDSAYNTKLGAFVVVSNPTVIPAPGALVLSAIGLVSSLPGINRLRRRR